MPKRAGDGARRATLRRVVPRHVDMGDLDGSKMVRVDPATKRYDVRDLMNHALTTKAAKDAFSAHGPNCGISRNLSERLRWADGTVKTNAGRHGRLVADAGACSAILKRTLSYKKRQRFENAREIVAWLEERAALDDAVPVHPPHVESEAAVAYTPVLHAS